MPWEEYLQDLKRRNIFSPIRAEGCPPIVGNPVGKTFRIAGIMIGPRSSVVLESLEGGVFLVLDEGERKDGVLLKKIGSAVVELEDNGRPVILKRSGGAS